MFKFIKRLFSGSSPTVNEEPEKAVSPSPSKNTKKAVIPFNPELISSLTSDHHKLLESFKLILESAKKKHYPLLMTTLNEFSNTLNAHLSREGVELYVYLELTALGDDRQTFRDFRIEMGEIASTVTNVINTYKNSPVTDENVEQFTKDFSGLGGVLVDRIDREEGTLYPLYK